jgi:hypothetical protein
MLSSRPPIASARTSRVTRKPLYPEPVKVSKSYRHPLDLPFENTKDVNAEPVEDVQLNELNCAPLIPPLNLKELFDKLCTRPETTPTFNTSRHYRYFNCLRRRGFMGPAGYNVRSEPKGRCVTNRELIKKNMWDRRVDVRIEPRNYNSVSIGRILDLKKSLLHQKVSQQLEKVDDTEQMPKQ